MHKERYEIRNAYKNRRHIQVGSIDDVSVLQIEMMSNEEDSSGW